MTREQIIEEVLVAYNSPIQSAENIKEILKKYLPDIIPDNTRHEYIINIRKYAQSVADVWFYRNYETVLTPKALYEKEESSGKMYLKQEFQDLYWAKVNKIEEELLIYSKK